MLDNRLLEFYNILLSSVIMCYLIYRLNTDLKRVTFLNYCASSLFITVSIFLLNFLFRDLDKLVMLVSEVLIIAFVTRIFHKFSIYYSALTALLGIILVGFADIFCALVYAFPQRLTSSEYKTSFIHISIGSVLMFLFIYILLKFIANNFIKVRKRIYNKYNKFAILLSVNLISVFSILIFVYCLFGLYLDYKIVSDKIYITYYSVIIITIVLIASIIITLYIINYFILNDLKYNRLKMLCVMDSMTDTLNRGSGLRLIEEQLESCKKSNKDLTICYIDINDLKVVNDMLGHREGDQLIKAIVGAVKENIRETDAICRLGGDEFVIVFQGCNKEYSENIMKRVSDKVSHLNLFESDKFDFSISYGFSEYGGNNEITVENLLNEADHQMYLNKKAIKAMSKVLII